MPDDSYATHPPEPAAQPRWRFVWWVVLTLLAGVAAFAVYLLCYHTDPDTVPWTLMLLVTCALAAGVVHHLSRWWFPLRRFRQTLLLIRQGEAPIDELSRITGPLASFRGTIQDMLRELRQNKVELAICQHEMRQRIAQRTDALERLVGTLRQQANRDSLTGLYNRRMFDQHLPTIVDRSGGAAADLCLLMLDLDNFKTLNDTLGHAAGDELLRTVGQLIRSSIRDQDLAFRCGGDEFVIVLPDHGHTVGHALARQLVCLVDEIGRTLKCVPAIGISAGLVCLSEIPDAPPSSLLVEADKRLYATKASRKGTPGTTTEPPERPPSRRLVSASSR